ncbi:MAG: hypothetical protein F2754_11990, partial [Actinobacteria bacterium]|nr:hypothetical protein [Actinomycetota bacterium]
MHPCANPTGASARAGRSRRHNALMRIVAGSARGRKLIAPDSPTTRPTS